MAPSEPVVGDLVMFSYGSDDFPDGNIVRAHVAFGDFRSAITVEEHHDDGDVDTHGVSANVSSTRSTSSGTDFMMPLLVADTQIRRTTSNVFEQSPSIEAYDAKRELMCQKRRRGRSI